MQDPESLNESQRKLAGSLQALQIALPQTSQREIWFRAGLEVGRRRASGWRAAAGILGLSVAVLIASQRRPASAPIERIVYVARGAAPAAPPTPISSAAYGRLRDAIIERGLNGLPPVELSNGGEPANRDSSLGTPFDPVFPVNYPPKHRG